MLRIELRFTAHKTIVLTIIRHEQKIGPEGFRSLYLNVANVTRYRLRHEPIRECRESNPGFFGHNEIY